MPLAFSRSTGSRCVPRAKTDAELGEILLRAFILRRVALIARGQGNVVFVGSRHSRARAASGILTRNGSPLHVRGRGS